MLYDNIILSDAQQKGVLVSIEEAKKYADNIRLSYNEYESSPDKQQLENFISAMGEDYYWNVYAPQKYQIGLSAIKLKKLVMTGSSDEENQKIWYDYLFNLSEKADLVINDNTIGVTKDELIDYIKTFNE